MTTSATYDERVEEALSAIFNGGAHLDAARHVLTSLYEKQDRDAELRHQQDEKLKNQKAELRIFSAKHAAFKRDADDVAHGKLAIEHAKLQGAAEAYRDVMNITTGIIANAELDWFGHDDEPLIPATQWVADLRKAVYDRFQKTTAKIAEKVVEEVAPTANQILAEHPNRTILSIFDTFSQISPGRHV